MFGVSAAVTAIVKTIAKRSGFVSRPREDRYHRSVIALGGGTAIFWTIALFVVIGVVLIEFAQSSAFLKRLSVDAGINLADFKAKTNQIWVILGGLAVLHLLGLWDDMKRLGPYIKLAVQFAVAIGFAVFADVRVELFIYSKAVTTILSAVWIVFLINSFNFLDNMDGLAAGISLICGAILFWAAAASGQVFVAAFAIVFLGAVAGFLLHNFPPASIFMGDAGSLVIGACLGILTLRTTYYDQTQAGGVYAVFMPLVVMAVPVYDFLTVTALRISQGKSPLVGDTQHFSHRLQRRGLDDRQTVLTLYLATLCTALAASFLSQVSFAGAIAVFAQTLMILGIIAILEFAKPDK